MTDQPEGCCFDDWARGDAERARKGPVRKISTDLVDSLERAGLAGRTILDLGCGAGGVTVESVLRGAARGTGIDLSPVGIDEGRALAAARGLGDRITFLAGDASTVPLEPHDVVVLNRVFCCYPHPDRLLGNSLSAARSVYAFTLPPSTGVRGVLARIVIRFENLGYRLRSAKYKGFRTYVHDVGRIEDAVRSAGFHPIERRSRLAWELRVYGRHPRPDQASAAGESGTQARG